MSYFVQDVCVIWCVIGNVSNTMVFYRDKQDMRNIVLSVGSVL